MPVKINGTTSGSVTLAAPDTGSDVTLNLGTMNNQAAGYSFRETIYYTSSGTFTKATYPWLRAIRVKVQGGGGGGSGAQATNASQYAIGGGGGGGGYAESFITNIAGLGANVTVTVGSGGAGGAAGINVGSTGGTSSFGALVTGDGGYGGYIPALRATSDTISIRVTGPAGGGSGSGDLVIAGKPGRSVVTGFGSNYVIAEPGGDSFLGVGANMLATSTTIASAGLAFGGGGAGRANSVSQAAGVGGAGANGIVIVELYA